MQCTCFFPPRPFKHHCDNYLFIYIFTQRQDDQSLLLFSCSSVSNSFWPHGLQHTRLPCPSLYPSLPKFMSIDLMMPSNHLILCHLLLLLPSIFPSIRVFFPRAILKVLTMHKHWDKMCIQAKQHHQNPVLSRPKAGSFLHSIKRLEKARVDIPEPCKEFYLFIWVLAAHVSLVVASWF